MSSPMKHAGLPDVFYVCSYYDSWKQTFRSNKNLRKILVKVPIKTDSLQISADSRTYYEMFATSCRSNCYTGKLHLLYISLMTNWMFVVNRYNLIKFTHSKLCVPTSTVIIEFFLFTISSHQSASWIICFCIYLYL